MGFDSVSLSTRTGLGSIYNQWKYAINNKKTTDNFKTYLLSSQEHLNQLETLFTDYGHVDGNYGDTFVKESIIELNDGRLLCMDPNEAKAYILDLNNVNSSSEKYNLTVIKPEDTSLSFAEQITNLISKISAQLGADGVTTTKDGVTIDSSLLIGKLSGNTKTQYCDEMGIVDTSSTDNTYTSGNLKLIAAKGITDITTNSDEWDYYKSAFIAQGIEIESDGTTFTSGSTAFIAKLNSTINDISTIINKGSTATDQDKLNLLQTIRKMSTFEYELLEKMNPGFTQALNTFIGDFQSRTYLDRNGNQTGSDETISYETVMREKVNNMSYARSYLNESDRAAIDEYIGTYANDGTQITIDNIDKYLDEIITKIGNNDLSERYAMAQNACNTSSSSVANNAMYEAISQTVTFGVSSTTIDTYKKDIENAANKGPDAVLNKFLEASNTKDGAEIIARILEDESMVDALKTACAKKGTLSIVDSRTGKAKVGSLYSMDGQIENREYNVENILNHLEYLTKAYYSTKLDSTSGVNSARASNNVDSAIYVSENGDGFNTNGVSNTESIRSANTGAAITATATGTVGGATAIIAGTAGKAGIGIGTLKGVGFWKTCIGWNALDKGAGAAIGCGAAGTTILGTGLGAAGGLWVGNKLVESNPDKYTNANGTYNNGKANLVKALSTISGAAFGFAASSAWGWPWTAIAGGLVGIGTAIATAIVHNVG